MQQVSRRKALGTGRCNCLEQLDNDVRKDFGPELEAGLRYPHGMLEVGEDEVVKGDGAICFETVGDGAVRLQ